MKGLIMHLNSNKDLQNIKTLIKNLSMPLIYWVDGYKTMRSYLRNQSTHDLKDDLLFNVGSANIMTVLVPGVCDSKNISKRMLITVSKISMIPFEGGGLYEAASILKPDVLISYMKSMNCFIHYQSKLWDKMLYDTLRRDPGVLKNKRVFRM